MSYIFFDYTAAGTQWPSAAMLSHIHESCNFGIFYMRDSPAYSSTSARLLPSNMGPQATLASSMSTSMLATHELLMHFKP